jgi:hypothetical protein
MKRLVLIGIGIVGLVLLVGGAAFLGGRLVNGEGQGFSLPFGIDGNGEARQGLYLQVEPAKEIPTAEQTAIGAFIRRADNSVFIGTGKRAQVRPANQSGNVTTPTGYSSEIEVVVTHDTRVYRDVTDRQFKSPPQNGQRVQQVVEAGQIEEIGEDSNVQVWGRQNGNRIIADVLLYSIPSYLPAGVPKPEN